MEDEYSWINRGALKHCIIAHYVVLEFYMFLILKSGFTDNTKNGGNIFAFKYLRSL
ncbi:MAG: hypothetical protein IEMM0001_0398 [bacterium]|nr:MAG: hypothetical protein IEMM0001_0398 [bacterium]